MSLYSERSMKKKIFGIIVIISAGILVTAGVVRYLRTVPVDSSVNQAWPGWLIFPDGREPVPCQAQLVGTYYHYRLDNDSDYFDGGREGGLFAEGIRLFEYIMVYFYKDEDYSFAHNYYNSFTNKIIIPQTIAMSKALDVIVAGVSYDTQQERFVPWNTGNTCLLVAPASNQEEAEGQISRLRDYFQENGFDSELEWLENALKNSE